MHKNCSKAPLERLPWVSRGLPAYSGATQALRPPQRNNWACFLLTQKKNTQWDLHIFVAWLVSLIGSGLSLLPWILKNMYCIGGYTVFSCIYCQPFRLSVYSLPNIQKAIFRWKAKDGFFDKLGRLSKKSILFIGSGMVCVGCAALQFLL